MEDKDHETMLEEICKKAEFLLLTKPNYKRAAEPEDLKEMVIKMDIPFEIVPEINQAYLHALKKTKTDGIVCITGSHFTVGELLYSLETKGF